MNVFMYQAAFLCEDCGRAVRERLTAEGEAPEDAEDESSYDSDDFPKGPYPDGGGEADCPQHCDHCGVFLENPLTSEGEDYVKEAVRDARAERRPNSTALTEWAPFYDYLDFGCQHDGGTRGGVCDQCGEEL